MHTFPKLIRRRLIPDEAVELKNDEIIRFDPAAGIIITKWRALKPRTDFNGGISCYFLGKGYKVSKIFTESGNLLYCYCDIIRDEFDVAQNRFIFTDLLFDVIVYSNGSVKVLDIGEGAEALDNGLITPGELSYALVSLQRLLDIIYGGRFNELSCLMDGAGFNDYKEKRMAL